jgi:prepilin-type N-terminal cleavage/methylation domain-containing protein
MTRPGSTLIEMLITMALLGIIASVATLAIRQMTQPASADPMTIIADSSDAVIKSGQPVTLQFVINGRPVLATLNPDGSIAADSELRIVRFTGEPRGRSTSGR